MRNGIMFNAYHMLLLNIEYLQLQNLFGSTFIFKLVKSTVICLLVKYIVFILKININK